jgi:hypothetical protein
MTFRTIQSSTFIPSLLLEFFLNSCFFPCSLYFGGEVLDNSTGEPLDSVQIDIYDDGSFSGETTTDSLGKFSVQGSSHSTFIGTDCDRLKLEFNKAGYQGEVETTTSGDFNRIVRMKK